MLRADRRFWDQVAFPKDRDSCWMWTGHSEYGYGLYRSERAHRYAYYLYREQMPTGLDVHHTCGNTLCVNPLHLTTMSRSEHAVLHTRMGRVAKLLDLDVEDEVQEMPQTLEIPDKNQAQVKQVQIDVSAGKGDDKVETKFDAELPATLADAIAMFGAKEVFRRFINAHVVYLQSQKRNELTKETQERERKRAPYLESLGL